MSKSIVITVPHNHSVDDARRRIAEGMDQLRHSYVEKVAHSEVCWTGDRADVKVVAFSQTITAQLDVLPETVRIEVQLPWILAALGNRIQGVLTSNARASLEIEHHPPKR